MASTQFPSFDCSFALPLNDDATVVPTSPHASSDDAENMFADDMSSPDYVMNLLMQQPPLTSIKQEQREQQQQHFQHDSPYQPGNALFDLIEDLESGEDEFVLASSSSVAALHPSLCGLALTPTDNSRFISSLSSSSSNPKHLFAPLSPSADSSCSSSSTGGSAPGAPRLLLSAPSLAGMQRASPTPSSTFRNGSGSGVSDRRHTADPGRNARMAKENRERKKKYVAELESKIVSLQREKDEAHSQVSALQADLAKANQEIASLRSMLQNSSALAQVLAALGTSSAISFKAPLTAGAKRSASETLDSEAGCAATAPATKRPATRRSRGCGADDAAGPASAISSSTSAAPATTTTTVLPIQLNIHVHSNA